jgi:hypothetical protein
MSGAARPDVRRLPTLTDEVEPTALAAEPAPPIALAEASLATPGAYAPTAAPPGEAAVAARVLAALEPQLDALLEARLRLALARLSDALQAELRTEIVRTLHEAVARGVARELGACDGR